VTKTEYYGVPIRNFPTSFVRQDAIVSWDWDINSWLTWKADYQYETWRRVNRDVPNSHENSVRGRFDIKLPKNAKFDVDFEIGSRDPEFYRTVAMSYNMNIRYKNPPPPFGTNPNFGPGWEVTASTVYDPTVPLEFSQLRRFDEAGRHRYDGKAML